MPYTVKAITTWGDTSLSDEELQAKIASFYKTDHVESGFDMAPVQALRRKVTVDGVLLARGSVISPDGKQLITTMVWKSKADYETYRTNPITTACMASMRKFGWVVNVVEV